MSAAGPSPADGTLGSYGPFTGVDRDEATPTAHRPSGVEALADQLARARAALAEQRNQDVVDELRTTLGSLAGVAAATWSVLGSAYDQLGQTTERDDAYHRAVEFLDQAVDVPDAALVIDVVPAVMAAGEPGRAVEVVQEAVLRYQADSRLAQLLVMLLDPEERPLKAAAARAHAAALAGVGTPEAIGYLTEAVAMAPADADYRLALAEGLLVAGDAVGAGEHVQRAVELAPDDPDVLATAAETNRVLGRPDEAQKLVDACLAVAPEHALGLGVAGLLRRDAAQAAGDVPGLEEAVHWLDRSLAADPSNLNLVYARAACAVLLGRPEEAVPQLQLLVEARPGIAMVEATLAEALVAVDDLAGARAAFDRAVAADPGLAFAYVERSRVVARLGDLNAALADLDLALSLDPDNGPWRFERAEMLRLLGHFDEALAALDGLEADPAVTEASVVGTRGQILVALGDRAGGVADLDRALALDPGLAWVWRSKAEVFIEDGRLVEAVDALDEVIASVPQDTAARVSRGWLLVQLERPAEAVEAAEAALATDPTAAEAELLRAVALLEDDRPQECLDALEADAARAEPALTAEARSAWLGEALRQLGRYEEAIAAFDVALASGPLKDTALLHQRRGLAHYMVEHFDEAVADFDRAKELATSDEERVQALGWAGEALRRRGRLEDALARLDGAVALLPDDAFARGTRGQVVAAMGKSEEAVADLARALAVDPSLNWALVELGEQLRLAGRYPEALERLDAYLAANPTSAYGLATRGQVRAALGHRDEAIADLRAALEHGAETWMIEALAMVLLTSPFRRRELLEALERVSGLEPDADADPALGEVENALADQRRIDRALASERVIPELVPTRAEALRLLGRASDALAVIDAHLRDHPDDVGALGTRAAVLADQGENERSLAAADAVIALDAESTFGRSVRVRVLAQLDRHAEALTEIDRVLELVPEDAWSVTTKASLLSDYAQFDDALALLLPLLARTPDDPYGHSIAGFCCRRLGQTAAACEHLEAAVAGDPDTLWPRAELGDALIDRGDPDAGASAHQAALDRFSVGDLIDTGSLRSAAWCHLRLSQVGPALSLAQQAVGLDAKFPPGRFLLALVLLEAGRTEVAVDEYEGAATEARNRPDVRRRVVLIDDAVVDLVTFQSAAAGRDPADDPRRAARDEALALLRRIRNEVVERTT